jgi:hypothetical protein
MYKNGIPAEYLARQAMREAASNHPPNNHYREARRQKGKGEWIDRGELVPEERVLATHSRTEASAPEERDDPCSITRRPPGRNDQLLVSSGFTFP